MVRVVLAPTFLLIAPAGEHPLAPEPAPRRMQMPDRTVGLSDERNIGPVDLSPRSREPLYDDRVVMVGPQTGAPEKDRYARTTAAEACR
jgi:hypothetical protein